MIRPNPILTARMRSFLIYQMRLDQEISASGWMMQVNRAELLAAIDLAIAAMPARSGKGRRAATVTLIVCEPGLSVRSQGVTKDLRARGFWASPIVAGAVRLRSMVASLDVAKVDLGYSDGRLTADWKSMKAREL